MFAGVVLASLGLLVAGISIEYMEPPSLAILYLRHPVNIYPWFLTLPPLAILYLRHAVHICPHGS